MTINEKLAKELSDVLSGRPWYGNSVYTIISGISFEGAFERPVPGRHTVAEILLHMITWTEEVISRMQGNIAGLPASGNWPDTGSPEGEKLQRWVNDLKLLNTGLTGIIQNFPAEKWNEFANDQREGAAEKGVTYELLIRGFIQHQVYHAGQISLLNKINNG